MLGRLLKLFRPAPKLGPEAAQSAFREHYRNFRALLAANNNALELMSAAEEMLQSGKPFGMAFVGGDLAALTANVRKMVHSLIALSDGRYKDLEARFEAISGRVHAIVSRQPVVQGTAFVLTMDEIDRNAVDEVGAKMANLGELRNRLGLRVPDGFAVTAIAARHFMEAAHVYEDINRRLQTLDVEDLEALYRASRDIEDLIRGASLPGDLERLLIEHSGRLAQSARGAITVSMRSSALGEDTRPGSFAGQYRTRLNVPLADITATYKDIVAGKYRSQAIVYREQRGYRHQDVLMCVGCLTMVDAVTSGVAYSRPPDDARNPVVVIHAAPGLGNHIVDGTSAYDLLHVARAAPHGITAVRLAQPSGSCLSDAHARELAALSVRIEDHFGSPQDIEWAVDGEGRLVFLQARPVGASAAPASYAEGERRPVVEAAGVPLMSGGVTASGGAAAGPVCKVASAEDVLRFPRGGVLVVETPDPEWAVVVNRAAAVVSESGQMATHLATVAREFGVPALFDLPGVMAELAEGQMVTVDATGRRIHAGRIEALLDASPYRPNLMEGSPIHQLLKEALSHITPLTLTAPESPAFRPRSCRTLHDITRFCHEKSLAEMLHLGRRFGVRDKSAKQLYVVGQPSQWWVVNVDDGFRPDADLSGPFIRIEDIVSEPMHAIWQGMTAVPWQGPPAMSLRGFGSIVAQSAMNPHLDPAVHSNMSGRNYFLISRTYCNLSVRLGYHFALAEASFSDVVSESYVNFSFQGGAADEHRRRRRVNLLAEALREIGFRIEVKGDAVMARIEKRPTPYLRERLMILGYLLIHTRQMDMVMHDAARVGKFMEKIRADIQTIRESAPGPESAPATRAASPD
ncbi:MAG TPA: PEP/pyruvate-binding domain-containing protein [Rhodocyclaceae bacterium]